MPVLARKHIHERQDQRCNDHQEMDQAGPDQFLLGMRAYLEKDFQKVNRRNRNDRCRKFDFQRRGIKLAEPRKFTILILDLQHRDRVLVTADDNHDNQTADENLVDEGQHVEQQFVLLVAEDMQAEFINEIKKVHREHREREHQSRKER